MSEKTSRPKLGLKAKTTLGNTITYIVIISMCIIWLIPFFCILLESFRMETTMQVGYVIPKQWGIGNYVSLIQNTNFVKWYTNTLVIALAVSVIQTFTVFCVS
ncbi:MAG: hypothetical protein IJ420_02115, partial [Lachnospiraceae bacterium]|nr:hypothetical protein [Lachnospiraceae bacterium]